ncbi:MAG: hypothetical protein CM15mP74_10280 [Halieaceae bacterium]|nr:MAG: hypothetical protein CM15mP74_10280 [Halieaceae bacterium]
MRLQYKPMVRWLWLGALMIGLGALLTVVDRRYRTRCSDETPQSSEWQALRLKRFAPLLGFVLLAGLLYKGLSIDPTALPAARVGQPFPSFTQLELTSGREITEQSLSPGPALVNVGPRGAIPVE